MSGFDAKGPRGMGPMTGGGRGFCGNPDAYEGRWPADARSSAAAADGGGATSITPRDFPDGSVGAFQPAMPVTP